MKIKHLFIMSVLAATLHSSAAMAAITFPGGHYWLIGMSHHNPWFAAESDYSPYSITPDYPTTPISAGDMIPPGVDSAGNSIYQALLNHPTDGPKYHAQVRARTTREIRWGMRVNFTTPDATGAGKAVILLPGQHRHMIQFGDDGFTGTEVVDYQVDALNRFSIILPGGINLQGAFTTDHEALLIGETDDGIGFDMGVKVASGVTTLPDANYGWNSFMLEINRDDTVNTDGENGNEQLRAYLSSHAGWLDLATSPGNFAMNSIGAKMTLENPETLTPLISTALNDEGGSGLKSDVIGAFIDGAGSVGPQQENWLAVSPSGEVAIMTGSQDYDLRFSDASVGGTDPVYAHQYRHNQSYSTLVELAPAGTHTLASLAGTYFLVGMWDNYDGASGNSSAGVSIGEVILDAAGTGSFSFNTTDNLNITTPESDSLTWATQTTCLGVDTFGVRLPYTSPTCVADGGKLVDMVVVSDTLGNTLAWMLPSTGGRLLSYFDPAGLEAAGATSRSLGNAVRLP